MSQRILCVSALLLLVFLGVYGRRAYQARERRQAHVDASILAAVAEGNSEDVRAWLERGADATQRSRGNTVLHTAVLQGSPEVVRLLIDHGADPDARNLESQTPLHWATCWNVVCNFGDRYLGAVQALLAAGADPNAVDSDQATPLHYMAWWGPNKTTDLLISMGASASVVDLILLGESTEAAESLRSDTQLVDHPGARGLHPLHAAAWTGDLELARWLSEKGADVNARSRDSTTPMILAAWRTKEPDADRLGLLDLLLARSADARAISQTYGTALHGAARCQGETGLEMVRLLLENGADVNATDLDDNTALHMACRFGRVEVAKLLLESGADPRAANRSGYTPLSYVEEGSELHRLLSEHEGSQRAREGGGSTEDN
ncbi:MAG: ankyrin repeat domain-containing protein [Verrucomicrobia bacterium]|nr:ankyrin repeat domain-containing protein [Verrucomicrobiota bacterium]